MPAATRESRCKQAQDLGWKIQRHTRDNSLYNHPRALGQYIKIWADGTWEHWDDPRHANFFEEDGLTFMATLVWDSGATRVRPRHFAPYLRRLTK